MRGAPQRGFAVAIRVIKALISAWMVGRPPVGWPESLVQYSRKRRRCHRRTVSGDTMTSARRQPVQSLARPTQNRRSTGRSFWAGPQSLVDGELLVQGEILKGELTMAADEEGEEPEEEKHEGDHEPRL
jgi:hypothetical protein